MVISTLVFLRNYILLNEDHHYQLLPHPTSHVWYASCVKGVAPFNFLIDVACRAFLIICRGKTYLSYKRILCMLVASSSCIQEFTDTSSVCVTQFIASAEQLSSAPTGPMPHFAEISNFTRLEKKKNQVIYVH
jgi:hypothetical protein